MNPLRVRRVVSRLGPLEFALAEAQAGIAYGWTTVDPKGWWREAGRVRICTIYTDNFHKGIWAAAWRHIAVTGHPQLHRPRYVDLDLFER